MKKAKILKFFIAICFIVIILLGIGLVSLKMNNDELSLDIEAYIAEMQQNQQTVYVVSTDDGLGIEKGEILEEGVNVVKQLVYTGLESYNYITEEDLGSTAIVDMDEGLTVMVNMVTPLTIEKDTREYEIQVANLMVDQSENDFVDIRIMFPDGSDFLVLPKKQIKNLSLEECVFWTYLNEEEILRLASATIDAYTITGTKIYATRYVESNLQEDATPTYLVNSVVQEMMNTSSAYYDVNLLTKATTTLNAQARENLESRLYGLTEEHLEAVNDGHGLEDTAKTSVLVGNDNNGTLSEDGYVTVETENGYNVIDNTEESEAEEASLTP